MNASAVPREMLATAAYLDKSPLMPPGVRYLQPFFIQSEAVIENDVEIEWPWAEPLPSCLPPELCLSQSAPHASASLLSTSE